MGGPASRVAASMSYAFDSGFSLAGGIASSPAEIVGDAQDMFGLNAAYSADNWGVALHMYLMMAEQPLTQHTGV